MPFEIVIPKEDTVAMYVLTERLCKTEDDTLVPEGDPRGRWLYGVPGQEVPMHEAIRYGLTKGAEHEAAPEPAAPAEVPSPEPEPQPAAAPVVVTKTATKSKSAAKKPTAKKSAAKKK